MADEKRTIADYEVITYYSLGGKDIVLAENPKADVNERYLCCFAETNGVWEYYTNVIATDDYSEALKIYGERITETAIKIQEERRTEEDNIGMENTFSGELCTPVTFEDSIDNQVIFIRDDVLSPEYRRATHQLMLCTGGFGSQANARGRTCYCTSLYDGRKTSFQREDIVGTVDPEKLPEWAKSGLFAARNEIVNKRNPRSGGEAR